MNAVAHSQTKDRELEITTMPKMKTKKAAAKRFKITGTGKFRRNKGGGRHILTKKTSKRKRQLGHSAIVCSTEHKRVSAALPYA